MQKTPTFTQVDQQRTLMLDKLKLNLSNIPSTSYDSSEQENKPNSKRTEDPLQRTLLKQKQLI